MTDLALAYDPELQVADLVRALSGDLATDEGMEAAIVISLFTDRRAADDDVGPEGELRGWWGDVAPDVAGDLIGSHLWLLRREKQTSTTLDRARQYAAEALQWLVDDGVAASIELQPEWTAPGLLGLAVIVARPGGPARRRYDYVWSAL